MIKRKLCRSGLFDLKPEEAILLIVWEELLENKDLKKDIWILNA